MTDGEGRNTWRTDRYSPCPRTEAAGYLRFLASIGYPLSGIEQAVADLTAYTGEAPAGDPITGGPDQPGPEGPDEGPEGPGDGPEGPGNGPEGPGNGPDAPAAILTGLAMSTALDNRFKWYQRLFGNRQIARSAHFIAMVTFVGFFFIHMLMVFSTGFSKNLNAITLDRNEYNLNGVMLTVVAVGVTIAFQVWAVNVSWTHTRVLQRISNLTVGRVMDLLFDHYGPRAEYREQDISPFFWPNGLVPTSEEWTHLKDEEFRDYRVRVHGLVENPVELSLQDLREMGHRDQITMHNCIQGWSAIGKWSGLPFTSLIELVKPSPEAKWVMFYSYGEGGEGGQYYDSHSIKDLGHNQSLLAYEMNGEPLPVLHGAPLRLRVENQLGFKQVKWIKEIEFVRHFSERGASQGGYNEDHEFYGYRDEI